jgi:hypothetical protein
MIKTSAVWTKSMLLKSMLLAGCVALCFAGETAFGAAIGTASSGDWTNTATWTGGIVPTTGDDVRVNNNRAVTHSTGTHTVRDLWVAHQAAATGAFNMTGGSLTVTQMFSTVNSGGGAGTTTISGGTLTAAQTHIGVIAGNTGAGAGVLTVSGGTLNWGSLLSVGVISSGTLAVDGTAAALSGTAITLSTNSTLRFDLGASSVSALDASGALTIDSAAKLIIDGSDYTGGNAVIDLVKFSSKTGTYAVNNITIQNLAPGLTGEIGFDADSMTLTVIPEPVTVGLFMVSGVGLFAFRRSLSK